MNEPETLADIVNQTEHVSDLVVISGRSGSGKTSLINELIRLFNGTELPAAYHAPWESAPHLSIRKAKKYTTREIRPDDDPNEFIYLSRQEFESFAQSGRIAVQYRSHGVGDALFGLSQDDLKPRKNQIIMTSANDEAVAKDLKYLYGSTNVFLEVANPILAQRISSRGGSPELIAERIGRLTESHMTNAYDSQGNVQPIGMDAQFSGAMDRIEGIAHIIVENYGCLKVTAQGVFGEILKLASKKRNFVRVPEQKRLKFHVQEGKDIVDVSTLFEEDYVQPTGVSYHNHGNLVPFDRQGYDYMVHLGAVRGLQSDLGQPKYFVRISEAGREIDYSAERSVMFRGCVIKPIESWGASNDTAIRDVKKGLCEIGMSPTRRFAGTDGSFDIHVCSEYFDGTPSYRVIRQFFEEKGLKRLV